jgi:hypothetical protein
VPSTTELIPPVADAVELAVDELALRLLRYLGACAAAGETQPLNTGNLLQAGSWMDHGVERSERGQFFQAISEAIGWLTSMTSLHETQVRAGSGSPSLAPAEVS